MLFYFFNTVKNKNIKFINLVAKYYKINHYSKVMVKYQYYSYKSINFVLKTLITSYDKYDNLLLIVEI